MARIEIKDRWLVIGVYLVVALPLAWYLNIWSDEGSSLFSTEHGFLSAFQNAAIFERQAPLYFWFLSLWREINGSIFFARIPSLLASAMAIWVFSRTCGRYFSPTSALLATLFFGLHPVLLWAGVEIRVYAFVILISVLLLYLFAREFFDDNEMRGSYRLPFVIVAIIGVYTNYYVGFLIAGLLVSLLVTRRWRFAANYALLMLIVGVACLPLLPILIQQLGGDGGISAGDRSLVNGPREIWSHVVNYVLPADKTTEDMTLILAVRLWLMRLALIVVTSFGIRRWRKISPLTTGLAAAVGTIIVLTTLVYLELGLQFILLRHVTVLFAPLVLLLASFLNDVGPVGRRGKTISIAICMALVCFFFSYTIVDRYGNLAKPGDWARIGSFIQQNESPAQPIVVFRPYDAITLPYEYRGINQVLPKDHFLEFGLLTPTTDMIQRRTDFAISVIPANASEIWLITNDECGSKGRCGPLEIYLADDFDTVIDTQFSTQRVRLLRRKQH